MEQTIEMIRPDQVVVTRKTEDEVHWFCHGRPVRDGNFFTWPNGTQLEVTIGRIKAFDPQGHRDEKNVGMGKLKFVDPHPLRYPLMTVRPDDGTVIVDVRSTLTLKTSQ